MTAPKKDYEPIWCDQSPLTPKIDEFETGLAFTTSPAENPDGPTVLLHVRYQFGPSAIGVYGSQLGSAINIVAINVSDGVVHLAPPVTENAIPLSLMMRDEPDAATAAQLPSLIGSSFTADLGELMPLPAAGGRYHVFLWMDDIVTPAQTVDVPPVPSRRPLNRPLTERPARLVTFGLTPTASAVDDRIVLVPSSRPGDRTVSGSWPPDPGRLIRAADPIPRSLRLPYYLSVLVFSHRDRQFGWVSVDLNRLAAGTDPGQFRFDPVEICGPVTRRQNVFVLATDGAARSNLLVLTAEPDSSSR